MSEKNLPKSAKKRQKEPKLNFLASRRHVSEPGEAGRSVAAPKMPSLRAKRPELVTEIFKIFFQYFLEYL